MARGKVGILSTEDDGPGQDVACFLDCTSARRLPELLGASRVDGLHGACNLYTHARNGPRRPCILVAAERMSCVPTCHAAPALARLRSRLNSFFDARNRCRMHQEDRLPPAGVTTVSVEPILDHTPSVSQVWSKTPNHYSAQDAQFKRNIPFAPSILAVYHAPAMIVDGSAN